MSPELSRPTAQSILAAEGNVLAPLTSGRLTTIIDVFHQAINEHGDLPAFTNMGLTLSFRDMDRYSQNFAAWLQHNTELQPGDRIILQLPNLLQFPIAVLGAIRAGLVVVNTNPLYTARELKHQINDSGAKAMVVLANMAHVAARVISGTSIKQVIVTEVGDMLPQPKRLLVNTVVRHVKKMVPAFHIPGAVKFTKVIKQGRSLSFKEHAPDTNDIAMLQYTGGTTGVAKGAMLTHRNLVANMLQAKALCGQHINPGKELFVAPLPLYHIYAFTLHCMVGMFLGLHNLLITNPRDMDGFIKELGKQPITMFTGLNTLFVGLMKQKDFRKLNFSQLKMTLSGGMALQHQVAHEWKNVTGCDVCEGFGMTETSPIACANRPGGIQPGTVGVPVAGTQVKLVNENGEDMSNAGSRGELCVKGPQVMKGYWQREEATRQMLDDDGWLRTGDIATISEDGFVSIVDRLKDMVIVSGFNVYPNEIEDMLVTLPGVTQSAIIGVPNAATGESLKAFIVRSDNSLTADDVVSFCRGNLAAYKVPRTIEFRDVLPTTNVGKVLRRELRDEELNKKNSTTRVV